MEFARDVELQSPTHRFTQEVPLSMSCVRPFARGPATELCHVAVSLLPGFLIVCLLAYCQARYAQSAARGVSWRQLATPCMPCYSSAQYVCTLGKCGLPQHALPSHVLPAVPYRWWLTI